MPEPARFNLADFGISPSDLAVTKGIAHREKRKNEVLYSNPAAAELVIAIVVAWKVQKWTPQQLNCKEMGLQRRTLRDKIRGGLDWLKQFSGDEESRQFYRTLCDDVRFGLDSDNQHVLHMTRRNNIALSMSPRASDSSLRYKAEFLGWIETARFGEKWMKTGIVLDPDDVQWFKDKLGEPMLAKLFVGHVKETEIRVIRTSVQKEL